MHVIKHLCIVALLLLAGCIEVESFGEYWEKGEIDAAIEGTWDKLLNEEDKDRIRYRVVLEDNSYQIYKGDNKEWKVKTLRLGDHTFLMLRIPKHEDKAAAEAKSNEMLYMKKYAVIDGNIITYNLSLEKPVDIAKFWQNYFISEEQFFLDSSGGLKIKTLNEETVLMLERLAAESLWWHEDDTYVRASNE